MAEIPYVLDGQVENSDRPAGTVAVAWVGLEAGDVGLPYPGHSYADRSIQVTGDFGVGGSCRIAGSNDGVNYVALSDPQGDVLNLTGAGIKAVAEITRYIRPEVTAGDGATALTVTLIARR